jgi:uncharacterized protein YbaA (DUF1428 family)
MQKKHLKTYRRVARFAGKLWRQHGALEYYECVGEDMNAKGLLPFPRLARLKKGEVVVFSWIAFRSRAHRDRVNAKVMKDPRLARSVEASKMPFDMKRMAYGGFRVMVDA